MSRRPDDNEISGDITAAAKSKREDATRDELPIVVGAAKTSTRIYNNKRTKHATIFQTIQAIFAGLIRGRGHANKKFGVIVTIPAEFQTSSEEFGRGIFLSDYVEVETLNLASFNFNNFSSRDNGTQSPLKLLVDDLANRIIRFYHERQDSSTRSDSTPHYNTNRILAFLLRELIEIKQQASVTQTVIDRIRDLSLFFNALYDTRGKVFTTVNRAGIGYTGKTHTLLADLTQNTHDSELVRDYLNLLGNLEQQAEYEMRRLSLSQKVNTISTTLANSLHYPAEALVFILSSRAIDAKPDGPGLDLRIIRHDQTCFGVASGIMTSVSLGKGERLRRQSTSQKNARLAQHIKRLDAEESKLDTFNFNFTGEADLRRLAGTLGVSSTVFLRVNQAERKALIEDTIHFAQSVVRLKMASNQLSHAAKTISQVGEHRTGKELDLLYSCLTALRAFNLSSTELNSAWNRLYQHARSAIPARVTSRDESVNAQEARNQRASERIGQLNASFAELGASVTETAAHLEELTRMDLKAVQALTMEMVSSAVDLAKQYPQDETLVRYREVIELEAERLGRFEIEGGEADDPTDEGEATSDSDYETAATNGTVLNMQPGAQTARASRTLSAAGHVASVEPYRHRAASTPISPTVKDDARTDRLLTALNTYRNNIVRVFRAYFNTGKLQTTTFPNQSKHSREEQLEALGLVEVRAHDRTPVNVDRRVKRAKLFVPVSSNRGLDDRNVIQMSSDTDQRGNVDTRNKLVAATYAIGNLDAAVFHYQAVLSTDVVALHLRSVQARLHTASAGALSPRFELSDGKPLSVENALEQLFKQRYFNAKNYDSQLRWVSAIITAAEKNNALLAAFPMNELRNLQRFLRCALRDKHFSVHEEVQLTSADAEAEQRDFFASLEAFGNEKYKEAHQQVEKCVADIKLRCDEVPDLSSWGSRSIWHGATEDKHHVIYHAGNELLNFYRSNTRLLGVTPTFQADAEKQADLLARLRAATDEARQAADAEALAAAAAELANDDGQVGTVIKEKGHAAALALWMHAIDIGKESNQTHRRDYRKNSYLKGQALIALLKAYAITLNGKEARDDSDDRTLVDAIKNEKYTLHNSKESGLLSGRSAWARLFSCGGPRSTTNNYVVKLEKALSKK